jgi:hypothetical protein
MAQTLQTGGELGVEIGRFGEGARFQGPVTGAFEMRGALPLAATDELTGNCTGSGFVAERFHCLGDLLVQRGASSGPHLGLYDFAQKLVRKLVALAIQFREQPRAARKINGLVEVVGRQVHPVAQRVQQ